MNFAKSIFASLTNTRKDMNKLLTVMPHRSRLVKCPVCKKYVFLTADDKFPKHYKNVYKNLVCGGSNVEFENKKEN